MEKIKTKNILVTGASSGIGLALCKLLIRDHDCYVFLGSRNLEKGIAIKIFNYILTLEIVHLV